MVLQAKLGSSMNLIHWVSHARFGSWLCAYMWERADQRSDRKKTIASGSVILVVGVLVISK